MTLLPTHPAPDLALALVGGGTTADLKLGSGHEGRFSVIVFFRGLHCSNCRKQLAEIDGRLGELKDVGVGKVVAVSMETGDRSTLVVDQWHLADLPVAFGLDEESARSWGLNLSRAIKDGEPELFNEPGIFILDADGTLFWSTITTMPFGRPSLDDIIAGVRYARDHNYPARGSA